MERFGNMDVDDKKIVKEFTHETGLEEVKLITDILHHSGKNLEEKKKIEIEQEAWRTVNAMFADKKRDYLKALKEKDRALNEKDKLIEELRRKLKEKGE